jgi:uncharacterized membrane-anchored protein
MDLNLKSPAIDIEYRDSYLSGGAVVGLISIVKCASLLSLVIVFEMAWVIAARRFGGISGEVISFATCIVLATMAIYVFLVSVIAVRVMVPLFYRL